MAWRMPARWRGFRASPPSSHEPGGFVPRGRRHGASARRARRPWSETATAVAARLGDGIELLAPHGLNDLLGLIARRAAEKGWFRRWPRLTEA